MGRLGDVREAVRWLNANYHGKETENSTARDAVWTVLWLTDSSVVRWRHLVDTRPESDDAPCVATRRSDRFATRLVSLASDMTHSAKCLTSLVPLLRVAESGARDAM